MSELPPTPPTTPTSAPARRKGFWVGFPMGHTLPSRTDAATEALFDYFHKVNEGRVPWTQDTPLEGGGTGTLFYQGSARAEGIRIDDNRNDLCRMFLERREIEAKTPAGVQSEVLVMLDRDEIWPADGVAQLALACTPATPLVCGVYFQRSLDSPYPHVYRVEGPGESRWGEPCVNSRKLGPELLAKLEPLQRAGVRLDASPAVRFSQPDGTPLPETLRFLEDAFGGTGLLAIHATLLERMRAAGRPFYPWFREGVDGHGEKGDMAFFVRATQPAPQGLGARSVVDCSVYAGHLGEVLIGLPDFMETEAPHLRAMRDYQAETPITRVAIVIPTLDPALGASVLAQAQHTAGAGIAVLGVVVADYPKRGGTRALNDGLAAAMNMTDDSGQDAVLLLDDDVSFPQEGWLAALCAALSAPHVGAVGPSIPCRGPQGLPARAFNTDGPDPGDMPFLCGAAMLYKRAALLQVGALDEHMRHYGSDTDHGLALRKCGWRLVWRPDVHVDHAIAGGHPAESFFPAQWNADHDYLARKWGLERKDVATVAPLAGGSLRSLVGAAQ